MEELKDKYDIGVIVGRFQVHELHEAHKEMIEEVISRHEKVIIFLGVASVPSTKRNPLDFRSRKVMIEEEYGNDIIILPVNDKKSDKFWSQQLDIKIREVEPFGTIVLYGSRDSFIPHYSGKFKTIELVPSTMISATEIRNAVSKKVERDKNFRAGVIYSTYNSYHIVHPTIDVAIMNEDNTKVLLGRKKSETEFRFIGGFVDNNDESYEITVKRETKEETGLEIDDIKYICSTKVNDWRYSSIKERSIMTTFFKAKKIFGSPKPNDDIVETKWVNIIDLKSEKIVGEHEKLVIKLLENLNI